MNKAKQLQEIANEIASCPVCPVGKSGLPVPGEGNPDANVVFIGEAPGKTEAKTGRPFIGRSGKFLRTCITEILRWREEDVYITSPVKYLPDRGTPTPADIAHGRIHLMKQLDVIQPKYIVLMGNSAVQGVLEEKIPVKSRHGEVIEKNGKHYFITLHPAAAIRFSPLRAIFKEDFQLLKLRLV